MANIHTLVASVNYLNLCSDCGNRLQCYDTVDALTRRRSNDKKKKCGNSDFLSGCGGRVSATGHSWRLCAATELRVVQESSCQNINVVQNQVPFIEIPVTCYQIIGVHDQAEKDEIVKSVMHLKNAEIEEGYTKDVVISRQDLLMDVRDKLLFEPEYAGNFKDKQPPKSSLKIPWAWLPGALCLLQEVGDEKLVLEIGRKALQHPESKPFVHDLLLSMALAECAIAKVGFEKNYISQGFEALARAQCLLRSTISLGRMMLLSQIEESLEELAPACTLDLLGMPHTPENAERRIGAIEALRELLRQGLDVETSCQVEDWPCFLNQALRKLMATEIVELISWDSLALTRKNRKSLESHNQRVVIDFNSFYVVLLAHIALGFSSKQTELITKAKSICECLIASEGIDLKFEEAFCSFLLGQGDEATAVERLRQLEVNSTPSSRKSLQMKETREVSSANKLLVDVPETWLKEAVLGLFPDTRDCSPSLADFFRGEKRASGKRQNKRAPPALSNMRHRSLAGALPLDQRDEEPVSITESSRHLGPAVKQLAPPNLQSPLIESTAIGSPSIQLKRTLSSKQGEVWKTWLHIGSMLVQLAHSSVLHLGVHANIAKFNISIPLVPLMTGLKEMHLYSEFAIAKLQYFEFPRTFWRWDEFSLNIELMIPSNLAKTRSCFWRFVLLQLTIVQIEVLLEEAAELLKLYYEIKPQNVDPTLHVLSLLRILRSNMGIVWCEVINVRISRPSFWRSLTAQISTIHFHILKNGMLFTSMAKIRSHLWKIAQIIMHSILTKSCIYYSVFRIQNVGEKQFGGCNKPMESARRSKTVQRAKLGARCSAIQGALQRASEQQGSVQERCNAQTKGL
ncbi:hypothetical protein DH2020_019101 [Rehmannia glutinosa]|uniref:Uncharacterized protein n=1 Tax=Rehmannia glutinosa TaxID=99300 RepID=A0ABR0WPV3_REHGL